MFRELILEKINKTKFRKFINDRVRSWINAIPSENLILFMPLGEIFEFDRHRLLLGQNTVQICEKI